MEENLNNNDEELFYENVENESNEEFENNSIENENIEETTTANTVVPDNSVIDNLQQIHTDLGVLISFICVGFVIVLCHYAYKFFNMFFVI